MSSNLWRSKIGHLCEICGSSSRGEYAVAKLLQKYHIKFEREYTFDDCIYPFSSKKAKFDFYVDNSYIIEIDGEHHYKPIRYGNNTSPETAQENFV